KKHKPPPRTQNTPGRSRGSVPVFAILPTLTQACPARESEASVHAAPAGQMLCQQQVAGTNSCSAESWAGEVARPHVLAHSFSCGALCKITGLRSRSESVRAARKRGPFSP